MKRAFGWFMAAFVASAASACEAIPDPQFADDVPDAQASAPRPLVDGGNPTANGAETSVPGAIWDAGGLASSDAALPPIVDAGVLDGNATGSTTSGNSPGITSTCPATSVSGSVCCGTVNCKGGGCAVGTSLCNACEALACADGTVCCANPFQGGQAMCLNPMGAMHCR